MICKNCGSQKFKKREELTENEEFLIERLSTNQEFSKNENEDDLFCKRCLYQNMNDGDRTNSEKRA
ncbi:MAG: hypothetical protein HKN25_17955 [Pyrinomonadaceae bacterium]|nr:hypothetical protein [Pyrinomonadaceae bacterium]